MFSKCLLLTGFLCLTSVSFAQKGGGESISFGPSVGPSAYMPYYNEEFPRKMAICRRVAITCSDKDVTMNLCDEGLTVTLVDAVKKQEVTDLLPFKMFPHNQIGFVQGNNFNESFEITGTQDDTAADVLNILYGARLLKVLKAKIDLKDDGKKLTALLNIDYKLGSLTLQNKLVTLNCKGVKTESYNVFSAPFYTRE